MNVKIVRISIWLITFVAAVGQCVRHQYTECNDSKTNVIGNHGIIGYKTNTKSRRECRWIIKIPNPGTLDLELNKINIATTKEKSGDCSSTHQKLEIISTMGSAIQSHSLCGDIVENIPITLFNYSNSEATEIEIKFTTFLNNTIEEVGFEMAYSVSCDQSLSGNQGQFQSADYGQKGLPGLQCATKFSVDPKNLVEIYFSEIDVKSTNSLCLQNYVEIIRNGIKERICSKKLPSGKYLLNPKSDSIKYVTDNGDDDKGHGFVASWITVPNPSMPEEKTKDMTWIGLLLFGVFTLATIFFVMFWARKNRTQIPRTPDSQVSGNTVFKFDDERGPFRRCNSEGSSVRSSVRGRISKRNNTKWNINDSVVAKKRAANMCNRQISDSHLTPVRKQHMLMTVERSMSAEESYPGDAMSPPPNYDTYFGFYSTRRAKVMASPCLPPRSAGFNDRGGIDSPNFNYDRVNFATRPRSMAYDSQRIWRSTDSIPDRWNTKPTEPDSNIKSRIEGKVNSGYEFASSPANKPAKPEGDPQHEPDPIQATNVNGEIRTSKTKSDKTTVHTKKTPLQHVSEGDISQDIEEKSRD